MKKIYVAIVILVLLGLSLYLMEGDEKGNKTGEKIDDKESDKESNNRYRKKDDKDDKCYDNGNNIYNCNTLSFDECVECDKQLHGEGILLDTYCGKSDNATSKECFNIPDNIPNDISILSYFNYKNKFCSSNINATYDDCQSVNYEKVFCDENHNKNDKDLEKCKESKITSHYCATDEMANYGDCQDKDKGYEKDYCAWNPKVERSITGMEKCCPSDTGNQKDQKDYLKKYIQKYKQPKPFDTPNINERMSSSFMTSKAINDRACRLRENCKNITVTLDNVYPVRQLCSNVTIGYDTNLKTDKREYDFSDTICKKIKKLVEEDKFNNVYFTDPIDIENGHVGKIKDGHVGKIKDGVYTYNIFGDSDEETKTYKFSPNNTLSPVYKNKIIQNGYEDLIREYCHCLEPDESDKPDICKLIFTNLNTINYDTREVKDYA